MLYSTIKPLKDQHSTYTAYVAEVEKQKYRNLCSVIFKISKTYEILAIPFPSHHIKKQNSVIRIDWKQIANKMLRNAVALPVLNGLNRISGTDSNISNRSIPFPL